ncbi:MAG TPA: metal ABC transporter permease [Burkholderiales bacterium]|nr:metal ABC transporter permease [Burkholderiales bacterium]
MNVGALDAGILLPALAAGLIVGATHVPLGMRVLARGIVFIDLAVAQIAALGVVVADYAGFEARGAAVQLAAFAAALGGAGVLNWTEKRWPELQEALIGVAFVLAATAAILVLAHHPHGGESLRDLLSGQILWVSFGSLAVPAVASAAILVAWFAGGARRGSGVFYVLFACAVTISVQLVGIFLVFATLIVPALATRYAVRGRMPKAYAVAVAGYALGLVASALFDAPSGPAIVWAIAIAGVVAAFAERRARVMA